MTIYSFSDLYNRTVSGRPIVGEFLSGHLAIEFLLRKILEKDDPSKTKAALKSTHAELIELVAKAGRITAGQKNVLTRINKMRNNFSHQLAFEPSVEELKDLYLAARNAYSDQTDGIAQGLDALNCCSSLNDLAEYAIPELFVQICYDLHEEYQNLGGDLDEF